MNEPQTSDPALSLTAADRLSALGKSPASLAERKATDRSLEIAVSYVLQWGMMLASAIVVCGGAIYLWRHGSEPASFRVFVGEPQVFCSPIGALQAALAGRGRGWIQVGIMVLIATPMVRVTWAWLTFFRKQDWLYWIITSIVLGELILSFASAYL